MDISYDGSGFRGFARNPGVRTVQGVLEESLEIAVRESIDLTVAGRTDAGVHARHNVISFSVARELDPRRLMRSVNTMLGGEVVVTYSAIVTDDFDARFSATGRGYRYFVSTAPVIQPLDRLRVLQIGFELDESLMNEGVAHLVGLHDFASLCRAAKGRSTMRNLRTVNWSREGDRFTLLVEGSSFCHQMVRSIVALSIDIGRGKVDPGDVPGIIAARERNASRGAAPPHGLVLWEIRY